MSKEISKSQIDRLGDRLRKGNITEDDLRLLDQYRRSFTDAYEVVVGAIRNQLGLEPTGRPAKSTTSISDKLRRESIRLTQIQDIAGCRLIVTDIADQERVVQSLKNLFETATIVDRRQQPSHGYRAVHVIANCRGKLIEIQVRTSLQHLWAELSEKFSDVIDPAIKYGGGDKSINKFLTTASSAIANEESVEIQLVELQTLLPSLDSLKDNNKNQQEVADIKNDLSSLKQRIFQLLRDTIDDVEILKGEDDALSD